MLLRQIVERGVALLGFAAIGSSGLVLLATRTRPGAVLPGGHVVRLVTESRWIAVPLQACPREMLPCIPGGAASCGGGHCIKWRVSAGWLVRLVAESRWVAERLQARPWTALLCICREVRLNEGESAEGSPAWLP